MNTFLLENPIWKVCLSNSESIISDSQYINDKSDWERLKDYCISNNLTIDEMYIVFRDNTIKIPKANRYFFRRMSLARFGKTGRVSDTYEYFIVGSTNDPLLIDLKFYLVPELQVLDQECRTLEKDEISLI